VPRSRPGATGRPPLTGHANIVNDVAFNPDGTILATASSDRTIQLWKLITGKYIRN